jgi:iron complex outermembrane receptor protein
MSTRKGFLIVGAALPALLWHSAVYAQQAAPAQPAATASQSAGESSQIDDIVVTANRRSENVQRVSLSIEALSEEALVDRGVSDSQSLNDVVPGLKIAYTGAQVQTFVRGVGDVASNAYTQASVSLNVDGIYIARSSAFGSVFFDIARTEVLRGPQGTLYGRNSSGGALNIISNAPNFDGFSGYVVGEVGNYELTRFQGAINAPISDTLAVRGALQVSERDGYLSDGGNDDSSVSGRFRALWRPSDNFSLGTIVEAAQIGGVGYGRVYRPAIFNDPWVGTQDPRITTTLYPALRVRNPDGQNSVETDYWGVSAEAEWDLGFGALTVIPAYRHVVTDSRIASDFVFFERDDSDQMSLEARLSGETGQVRWVAGAYGFNEDLEVFISNDSRLQATLTGAFQIQDVPSLETSAWAVFGESTFSMTDDLRFIAGMRYTEEEQQKTGTIRQTPFTNGVAGVTTSTNVSGQQSNDAFTWRLGAEYDLLDASMLYYTASTGFKSGGFNSTDADKFEPEYVMAHTLGLKNRFYDGTLQLNFEAFHWKYEDQQFGFLGQNLAGVTTFITRNAGQSTIYGGNVDMVWRITDNGTLDVGLEYLQSNYDEFLFRTTGTQVAGTVLADGCISNGPSGVGFIIENCTGNPLPRTPEWSGNVRYAHVFDFADGSELSVAGTVKFQTNHFLSQNFTSPNFFQEGYELFDVDATYRPSSGNWSLQAYVRNINDEAVYLSASNVNSIPPSTGVTRTAISAIGAPRTFGARLRVNF